MSILFCTSFNQELYNASGHSLLNSFEKYQKIGNLFIGYEGWENSQIAISLPYVCNLNKDVFLQTWLEENKDIIPEYLGGKALPCNCPTPMQRKPETHVKKCRYNWFNRNCSRWFRKIATLHAAYNYIIKNHTYNGYKYLIWIDCDCEFKKEITEKVLNTIFEGKFSIFYMQGTRLIPETGVFGFAIKQKEAKNFLYRYFDFYQSKHYLKYERWDDSYIFYRILKEAIPIKYHDRDIVKHIPGQVNVLKDSLLKKYLTHAKGRHGMKLNIMK